MNTVKSINVSIFSNVLMYLSGRGMKGRYRGMSALLSLVNVIKTVKMLL